MRRRLPRACGAACLLAIVLGVGLVVAGPPAGAAEQSLTVDGATRTFVFHRGQAAPATGAPLFVLLHGSGGSGGGIEGNSHFDAVADRVGALVIYPDAQGRGWEGGCCDAISEQTDDLDFMAALVDWAATQQGADRTRVYFAGFSAGGYFAYRIACQRPTLVAGIASVAGDEKVRNCAPTQPISAVEIHGTDDAYTEGCGRPVTPCDPSTSNWHPGIDELAEAWRYRDLCPNPTAAASSTQGNLTYISATGCSTGSSVLLVREQSSNTDMNKDLSHCWPGSPGCQYQWDASSLIWSNLSPHRAGPGSVGFYDIATHRAGGTATAAPVTHSGTSSPPTRAASSSGAAGGAATTTTTATTAPTTTSGPASGTSPPATGSAASPSARVSDGGSHGRSGAAVAAAIGAGLLVAGTFALVSWRRRASAGTGTYT